MSASKAGAFALTLLLLPGLAAAQESAELTRLKAENEVFKLELRVLRKRLEAIEARLTKHLATPAARRKAWPTSPSRSPEAPLVPPGKQVLLGEGGRTLLVGGLRLPADAGAPRPADALTLFHAGLRKAATLPATERAQAFRAACARFGAFGVEAPHPFLLPNDTWRQVRLSSAQTLPVLGELVLTSEALGPELAKSRLIRVALRGRPKSKPKAKARHSTRESREARILALLGVKVVGWNAEGAKVTRVLAGSRSGLQRGQILQSLRLGPALFPVTSAYTLSKALEKVGPGATVKLGLKESRNGEAKVLQVKLEGFPRAEGESEPVERPSKTKPKSKPQVCQDASLLLVGPKGPFELRANLVRINGRWLLTSLSAPTLATRAKAAVAALAELHEEGRLHELSTRGSGLAAKLLQARGHAVTPAGATTLELPLYRVQLLILPRRELGVRAIPAGPGYPTWVTGPIPGQHEVTKYPYRVRAWIPKRSAR